MRGRHLRGLDAARPLWRRPATLLWAGATTLCAAALAVTLLLAPADQARRAATTTGPPATLAAPAVVPDITAPDPPASTAPPALAAAPAVNRIEDFSTYPDGIVVQIEEAEWWRAPGSRHLELVKALVRIRNNGRRPFAAGQVAVTLRYGTARAEAEVVERGHFAGTVGPGAERFAQWLFALPEGNHDHLEIVVAPAADHRPAVFRGGADLP